MSCACAGCDPPTLRQHLAAEAAATAASKKPRVVVALGTRPERIKLLPVQVALAEAGFEVVEWTSGQSKDLTGSERVWGETLAGGIAYAIEDFWAELQLNPPTAVVVQGDTATAFACAQAAFLARIPVAHVEAGLRTYADEPWPEEAFRRQIAAVARWHFAPGEDEVRNLLREMGLHAGRVLLDDNGAADYGIYCVGNPVIDTLPKTPFRVLVTLHRRENWGDRIINALGVLNGFQESNEDDAFVCVIQHPNWQSWDLEGQCMMTSLAYYSPMDRETLLETVRSCALVVTDSGGLQEECAHFGVPCVVLRTATERVSLERLGAVTLVHPDDPNALRELLDAAIAKRRAYGDGTASAQIAAVLARELLR